MPVPVRVRAPADGMSTRYVVLRGSWSYVVRGPAWFVVLRGVSVGVAAAQAIAARANRRLFERYAHLVGERGKCHNKAKVAVVSELARWIWVVGMQVQAELQAPAA